MCSTRISLAVFRQLATHTHTHTHIHRIELDCVVSHQNNAKWQLPVFNTKSSITCITQAKSSTNNSLSSIVMIMMMNMLMITITIIMNSGQACIYTYIYFVVPAKPEPNTGPRMKLHSTWYRVASPLQADRGQLLGSRFVCSCSSFSLFLSHWFPALGTSVSSF